MSGVEHRLRQVYGAASSTELSKAYDDNCADGYIMKPFALSELLSEIQQLIKIPE